MSMPAQNQRQGNAPNPSVQVDNNQLMSQYLQRAASPNQQGQPNLLAAMQQPSQGMQTGLMNSSMNSSQNMMNQLMEQSARRRELENSGQSKSGQGESGSGIQAIGSMMSK